MGLTGRFSTLLIPATALSPVSAFQLATFYVDGAFGSSLTLVVIVIVNLSFRPERFDRVLLILAASLAVAIKFTGVPYVAVTLFILTVTRFLLHRRWQEEKSLGRLLLADAATGACVLSAGVFILGYNPYVTNMR